MITYDKLRRQAPVFQCLTGLTVKAFEDLLAAFERAYQQMLDQRDQQRPTARQRQRGGGRKAVLGSSENKLLFILVYFRLYPVQVVQGFLFGMGQPQANEWIQRLTPLLHEALGYQQQLPARQTKAITEVLAQCPGLEFILDGTERPIRRPKGQERQRTHYSGKKKRHTVKNLLVTDKRTRKITALSRTVAGKTHDKKLADEQAWVFPKGSTLWKDSGFQGYEPEQVRTYQPKKKPKGGELSAQDKARNTTISRDRIGIEHSLGGVKVFAIVQAIFRNLRAGMDDLVMVIACGLHNFRLDYCLTA